MNIHVVSLIIAAGAVLGLAITAFGLWVIYTTYGLAGLVMASGLTVGTVVYLWAYLSMKVWPDD